MLSYRVDVRPLLDEVGASMVIDDVFDLGTLRVGDESFVLRAPGEFHVAVTNAGAGIVAHGHIAADVTATCSRCVCSYPDRIEGDVAGFYLRPGDESPDDEDAEAVDAEGSIDIGAALVAALVVEAPFAPLHDEGCKGLCPKCGEDLNTGSCSCHEVPDDGHPFASLKQLLPEEGPDSQED